MPQRASVVFDLRNAAELLIWVKQNVTSGLRSLCPPRNHPDILYLQHTAAKMSHQHRKKCILTSREEFVSRLESMFLVKILVEVKEQTRSSGYIFS